MDELMDHWRESPPLPMVVRAFMGSKPQKPKRATKEDMAELAKFFGG